MKSHRAPLVGLGLSLALLACSAASAPTDRAQADSGASGSGGSGGSNVADGGSPPIGLGGLPSEIPCSTVSGAEPPLTNIDYTPTDADFLNPERGFHDDVWLPKTTLDD